MEEPRHLIIELLLIIRSTGLLALRLLKAIPDEGWQHVWKRLPLFILIWLFYALLNLMHIIGHLIDEIIFLRYQKTQIKRPVFIVGVPRSGTTLLQRIIAEDDNFSTLQTWEALLAPSISEKYLFIFIGKLLNPLSGFFGLVRRKLFKNMD